MSSQPPTGDPTTAAAPPSPLLLVALGLAAVTIAGNFLPWATLGEQSAAGIDGSDGKIVIGLMAIAIVALVAAARGARKGLYITAIVFAALAAAVGAINVSDIQDRELDFGVGIFMVIGGGIAFAVVCVMMAAQIRR